RLAALEDDPAALCGEADVTGELNDVAESLLGMDEQSFVAERAAVPLRRGKLRQAGNVRLGEPRLKEFPPATKVSSAKQIERERVSQLRVLWVDLQRRFERLHRRLRLSGAILNGREIEVRLERSRR